MDILIRLLMRSSLFLVAVFAAQAAASALAWADDWPLKPRPEIVRRFEPPPAPWAAGHRGVDLAGAAGQTVLAPFTGTVRFAGAIAGRGVVVLTHGSSRTTYEPVVAVVRVGQVLARGEPLGRLSAAGSHCAPAVCLHWGLLQGQQYVDPLTLVRRQGVRLLPLLPPGDKPALPPDMEPILPLGGEPVPPDGTAVSRADASPTAAGDGSAGVLAVGLAATAVIGSAVLVRRH